MRRFFRSLIRQKFELLPAGQKFLRPMPQPGTWRSTGAMPSIELKSSRSHCPSGWIRLAIDIEVIESDSAFGLIYADSGQGSEKAGRIRVPVTPSGKTREIVRFPDDVLALRYGPIKGEGRFRLGPILAQEIGWPEVFVRQMIRYCRSEGLSLPKAFRAMAFHVRVHGVRALWAWMKQYLSGAYVDKSYGPWIARHDSWSADKLRALQRTADQLPQRPKFSIIMPVYDTSERWLRNAIDSVRAQAYGNWELCVCDDNSSARHVAVVLDAYRRADSRIKVLRRSSNGHISVASNDAMSLATGDFMCLLDHDDVLAPHALFEFARALNEDPDIDLLYSDEDLISIDDVRYEPIIKPDWSPENLESYMYLGHLTCYRVDLARKLGGFRPECSGAQDYDFALRYAEQAKNIRHVREILYHWRAVPGSIAVSIDQKSYVIAAATRALEDRLQRTGDTGTVVQKDVKGWFEIRRDVVGTPLVSVVATKFDKSTNDECVAHRCSDCVESIRSNTTYGNCEIIVVDDFANRADGLNEAARKASGDYLVFLNGETEISSPDWIESMLRYAQRPGVGVVGAKILFSDDTLRHVGIAFCDGHPRHIRQGYPGSDWGYWGSSSIARNYLAVSGACMMISRDDFRSAGGFDPAMAPAFHDIDLCLKMVERGRRNVYAPAASFHQFGSDCRAEFPETATLFRAKWLHITEPDPFYGKNLTLKPPTFEFEPALGDRTPNSDVGR